MRKYVIVVFILFMSVFVVYEFYYFRWRHLWSEDKPISSYKIEKFNDGDDSIRVLLIGDSWAAMHFYMDSFLCSKIQTVVAIPVKVMSKGIGGEKSRGIYRALFNVDRKGFKSLIESGVDYL